MAAAGMTLTTGAAAATTGRHRRRLTVRPDIVPRATARLGIARRAHGHPPRVRCRPFRASHDRRGDDARTTTEREGGAGSETLSGKTAGKTAGKKDGKERQR